MKRQLLKNSVVLAAVLICFPRLSLAWEYPVIKGYGPVNRSSISLMIIMVAINGRLLRKVQLRI